MKSKLIGKNSSALWGAVVALTVSLISTTSRAATITWGSATNITINDTDVNTQGTLVGAVNFGDNNSFSEGNVTSAVVNGVTFQALGISNSQTTAATLGNFSLAPQSVSGTDGLLTLPNGNTGFGSAASPFSSLSTAYQNLLGSGVFINTPDTMILTMSGLTIGQPYLFQWWVNYSGPSSEDHIAAGDGSGDTVTLSDNTTGNDGGTGQFATGTFTANATSQQVVFQAPSADFQSAQVNAFQLRVLPVPEPATGAFLLGSGVLLLLRRRR